MITKDKRYGIVNDALIELKTFAEYFEGFTFPILAKFKFVNIEDIHKYRCSENCDWSVIHGNIKHRIIYKQGAVTYYYYKYDLSIQADKQSDKEIFQFSTSSVDCISDLIHKELNHYLRKEKISKIIE